MTVDLDPENKPSSLPTALSLLLYHIIQISSELYRGSELINLS